MVTEVPYSYILLHYYAALHFTKQWHVVVLDTTDITYTFYESEKNGRQQGKEIIN